MLQDLINGVTTISIRLDNYFVRTDYTYYEFTSSIGKIGGTFALYKDLIYYFLMYFTSIDLYAKYIKKLFLEKQAPPEFYNKYLNEEHNARKKWILKTKSKQNF